MPTRCWSLARARLVSRIDRRGSGSRGPVFRQPRLQKTVRVVAAHGIDAVRAYAVGGTANGTSNGIVGSPVNGFGRFRLYPRRRAASAERNVDVDATVWGEHSPSTLVFTRRGWRSRQQN